MSDREKLFDAIADIIDYIPFDIIEEVIDHLITNGVTLQKWIPVSERLPEREEDVLMLFETGIITGGFICDSDTWCAYSDGEYYTDCSNNPTHWMPLPEPPKECE